MFMGFPNHFTAEPAETAENSPYFLCEFGGLPVPVLRGCGEGIVTPPFIHSQLLYSLNPESKAEWGKTLQGVEVIN